MVIGAFFAVSLLTGRAPRMTGSALVSVKLLTVKDLLLVPPFPSFTVTVTVPEAAPVSLICRT